MSELFPCPDCEQFAATTVGGLCPTCAQWHEAKMSDLGDEYHEHQRQRERAQRLRMPPAERFAEDLADMAKAVERSKR